MRRNRDYGATRSPPDAVLPIAEYVYKEHFRGMNVRQEDVYATFTRTQSAGERFLYVFDLLKRHGWLPRSVDGFVKLSPAHRRWRKRLKKKLHRSRVSVDMDCSTVRKDGDASDAYRSRGNEAFKERADYAESLKYYTLSAMTATAASTGYALAVANRSASLYHLGEYEHSLQDVERALASGAYPPHNGYKLLERKGNCYRHLGRGPLAIDAYSDCLSSLDATQLLLAEKEIIQTRLRECISKCNETETKLEKPNIKCIRLSEPKNNNTSVLSKYVEINYSEETGRGLFVSKDIMPGEILIMEKPFAAVYKNDMWIFNCDYCFKRCLSSIPCPKCSQVLYCDETCLTRARDSYHGVECSIVYPLKGDPTVEPVHDLALRCFIQLTNVMGINRYCSAVRRHNARRNGNGCGDGSGGGGNNNSHFKHYNDGDSKDANDDGDGDDCNNDDGDASESDFDRAVGSQTGDAAAAAFRAVYGLNGNESRRTVSNMFSMHCTASMIVSVLQLNGFHVPPGMVATVGESLVHLLCVANLNSHASAEPPRHVAEPQQARGRHGGVALVLCPAYSLINHSCNPNVMVQTHDGVEVTRAVQCIPSGSQLFTDYGVNFMSHDKDDRHEHLWDQYQFHCECRACTQNWPTSQELDELCESKPSHLNTDSQIIGVPDTTLAKFNEIVHLLTTNQQINVDCLDFLFSFLNLLYSCNITKPRSIYYKCVRVIQKCLYSTSDQIRCDTE